MKIILLIVLLFFSVNALGQTGEDNGTGELPLFEYDPEKFFDVKFPIGASFGAITDSEESTPLGGLYVGVNLLKDANFFLSYGAGYSILIDILNPAVTRKAWHIKVVWHVYGGPRFFRKNLNIGSQTISSKNTISLITKMSFEDYAAGTSGADSKVIEGSNLNFYLGASYAYHISTKSSYGAALNSSIVSLPISTEGLDTQFMEVLGYYRILL